MHKAVPAIAIALVLGIPAETLAADDVDVRSRVDLALRRIQQAPSLRVRMRVSYDVLQDTGVELEFGSVRRVAVRRPDRFRVDAESREHGAAEVYFDGTALSLYTPAANAYARAEVGSTAEEAIDAMERDLGVPIPLDGLLRPNLVEQVRAQTVEAFLVGTSTLDGVPSDHLVLQMAETDVQLWLTRGDEPVIRRVVITYLSEKGRPQFRADLLDWEFAPELPDSLFVFEPPDGAEKVSFVRAGAVDERAETVP